MLYMFVYMDVHINTFIHVHIYTCEVFVDACLYVFMHVNMSHMYVCDTCVYRATCFHLNILHPSKIKIF